MDMGDADKKSSQKSSATGFIEYRVARYMERIGEIPVDFENPTLVKALEREGYFKFLEQKVFERYQHELASKT
jgi:hypothetical protein